MYNIEVAYTLAEINNLANLDANLADYARGFGATWFASDYSSRSDKRCNCYQFEDAKVEDAANFIKHLPATFSIDEVGIIQNEKFTFIYPYPRVNLSGDAVYDVLNVNNHVRRIVGACFYYMGV